MHCTKVVSTRGGCIETSHEFSAVVYSAGGSPELRCQVGGPITTTWRSAAKPFQLLASLEWLGAGDFSAPFLAIGTASHSAETRHVRTVRALLDVLGVSERALRCGAHPPLHSGSARALYRQGAEPLSVHNNCSGKHAFMAGALHARGQRGQDYRDPEHPFQRHVREVIERFTGPISESPGVDGCGVPCWILSIAAMARAWAAFAVAICDGDGLLGQIGHAMRQHPELVSGTERLDLAIAQASRGEVISKVGAAGLLCFAIPAHGLGGVVKIHSGDAQARTLAATYLLKHLLEARFDAQHPWLLEQSQVRNVVGDVVGRFYCD